MGKDSAKKCVQSFVLAASLLLQPNLGQAEEPSGHAHKTDAKHNPAGPDFDVARITEMLEKLESESGQSFDWERYEQLDIPDNVKDDIRRGRRPRLSTSELESLRLQLSRCWSPPVGATNAADLAVIVKAWLSPDGFLARPPQVKGGDLESSVFQEAAQEAALRAVRRCAPYRLPVEKYSSWREIELRFDPSQMLGR